MAQYWRIVWSTPLIISAVMVLMLATCFRHETPIYLQENDRKEEMKAVMKKLYRGTEVRKRIEALEQVTKNPLDTDSQQDIKEESIG